MSKYLPFFLLIIGIHSLSYSQTPDPTGNRDLAARHARQSEAWVRSGIIYEVYTGRFLPRGTLLELKSVSRN